MRVALSPILYDVGNDQLAHWCPGCSHAHIIHKARGHWNGDAFRPTYGLDIHHVVPEKIDELTDDVIVAASICRYTITDGVIKFHTDSSHKFTGQCVPMVEWPVEERILG